MSVFSNASLGDVSRLINRATGGYWQRLTTGTAHVLATDWVLVS